MKYFKSMSNLFPNAFKGDGVKKSYFSKTVEAKATTSIRNI